MKNIVEFRINMPYGKNTATEEKIRAIDKFLNDFIFDNDEGIDTGVDFVKKERYWYVSPKLLDTCVNFLVENGIYFQIAKVEREETPYLLRWNGRQFDKYLLNLSLKEAPEGEVHYVASQRV